LAAACAKRPEPDAQPTVLLRSGWQTENIGDIAHTPGVLHLLEQHVPEVRVILWSNATERGVAEMLRRRFPTLEIVSGEPDDLADTFAESDFLLHGSGPSVVARGHVQAWRMRTGKPYGVFGVTITARSEAASRALDPELADLVEGASFVYTRETLSLENLRQAGIQNPNLDFVPDGSFSVDLENDAAALPFLEAAALEPGRYICCIPRLRLTPYHKFKTVTWTEEEKQRRERINAEHADADHAKMRRAIERWVSETGGKVLLCPEMTYELDLLGPLLYDPLPQAVKPNVVQRKDYWLTDEACSGYKRAAAVLSFECHSPILAAAQGTPCMYIHQPEDGIKGQMWNDVGLGDWYLQVEDTTGEQVAEKLLAIHSDRPAAALQVQRAVGFAHGRQGKGMDAVKASLPGSR
ncbi:MAG: polysaccharide pyruvyl transferase family protein, partial [Acidobacteria bacterium]|nr:polysaccharide pyruvyl transferase family protein [Acidobacteriota bacterium]